MRAKKGFTLIELIVAMVLATMLLGALIPLLVTAQKSTYDAQKKTRAAQAGEAIYTYIAGQLRSAERVFLGDGTQAPADPPAEQWNQITVGANGCLSVNGVTPYPESYQEGAALTLTAQGHDRTALDLTVRLGDLYDKTSSFSLQNLIRTGFSQTEGIVGQALSAPAASGGALTIYYLGGDGAVSVFPTPDPNPDGSHTPPAEDQLTVTILNKSLRVKAGETAEVRAYIHVPAGQTASFTWASDHPDYVTPVQTDAAAPAAGTLSASGTVTLKVYGTKVTEDLKALPGVTVEAKTVQETKFDSAKVEVYDDNGTPDPELELLWNNSTEAVGSMGSHNPPHRSAQQTLEFDAKEFSKGFSLTPFASPIGAGDIRLLGTWEVVDGSQEIAKRIKTNEYSGLLFIEGTPPTGTVTLKFTCNGNTQAGGTAAQKYKNKWTYTTITFYNWDEVNASLSWANETAVEHISYYSKETIAGTLAATAQVSLIPETAGMKDYCARKLPGGKVALSTKEDSTGLVLPTASIFAADMSGHYSIKLPINYTNNPSERSMEFFADIQDKNGVLIKTAGFQESPVQGIRLTIKSSTWSKPAMEFYFIEVNEKGEEEPVAEKEVSFYPNNVNDIAATAWLKVTVKESDFAKALDGQQVEVVTCRKAEKLEDPAVGGAATVITLKRESGTSKELFAEVPLYFVKAIEEKTTFDVTAAVQMAGESGQVHLTVKPSKSEITLRLGENDPYGRIVNGATVYLGKNDPLYITAYDSALPTATPLQGTWGATGSYVKFLSIIFGYSEDAISAPAEEEFIRNGLRYTYYPHTGAIYTDKQTQNAQPRSKRKGGLFGGQKYSTTDISYSDPQGALLDTPIGVTLYLLDDEDRLLTRLYTEPKNEEAKRITVPVGSDISLYLKTELPVGASYLVDWSMSPATLFQPLGLESAENTGKECSVQLRSKNIRLTEPQEVAVTATWQTSKETVYGQQTVFITVEPLEQKLQQYQSGKWITVTDTIVCKARERILLRVVGADGKSLKGQWSHPDSVKEESQSEDVNAVALYTEGEGNYPVAFTPDSAAHPLYLGESAILSVQ